jgi:hypothetical protein
MPLSPTDGFVLSRIDGALTESDIVTATGLSVDAVAASLAKLEAVGLITYANGQPAPNESGPAPARSPAEREPSPRQSSVGLRLGATAQQPDAGAPRIEAPQPALTAEEQAAMAEAVDLDDGMKHDVLATHASIERLDHYALLGAERTADRKSIKRAYYELAGKFHPDKYFRKNLGSFKAKMEGIFTRVTLAHDVLSDREKRAEYDAYLAERRKLLSVEELMAEALDEVRRVEQAVERQVQAQGPTPSPAGGMPAAGPVPAEPPAAPAQSVPIREVDVAMAARRDALARRLLGNRGSSPSSGAIPVVTAPGPISASVVPSASEAMGALRRRYEERVARAKVVEANKYVANAKAAAAANDPIGAANAYRVAAQLTPDDPEVARGAAEAQAKADVVLGETYAKQAAYEEKNGQWAEASRSWPRVCKARPNDAAAHERAANALLKSEGDMHDAGRFAKRASELAPSNAAYRVTLASVYLAAGLPLGAKRELETAAQLSPQDDTIRSMLKKL